MVKEKRLGLGLEALMRSISPDISESGSDAASQESMKIDIAKIEYNPYQPRTNFDEDELNQLAASLKEHGLLSPIAVRKNGGKYQIIAGERRFRAALKAGWTEIPVYQLEVDDRQMVELALTENLQRADLNAIEKAVSMAHYLKLYGGTHEELAQRLGMTRSAVSNFVRLLDLPEVVQEYVRSGALTAGHARCLVPLEEECDQRDIAEKIIAEGWNVRDTEKFVQQFLEGFKIVGETGERKSVAEQSEQILALEEDFRQTLGGINVKLTQTNGKGKGKLVISFANHSEFETLYSILCRKQKVA
ncbi:MAG: ParB/RepB/Spo0J family partition protein [Planctomycetaceae bacterium]|nr:ParB/RepB/Spo0J family partition protein [Planctomycetaceae bacterium]